MACKQQIKNCDWWLYTSVKHSLGCFLARKPSSVDQTLICR